MSADVNISECQIKADSPACSIKALEQYLITESRYLSSQISCKSLISFWELNAGLTNQFNKHSRE